LYFSFLRNRLKKKNFIIQKIKNKKNSKNYPYTVKSNSFLFDNFFYTESSFFFKYIEKNLKEQINCSFFPIWLSIGSKKIKKLNNIQTKTFSQSFGSDSNLLISSPTGSGKTIIVLFCIFRIFINSINFKHKNWEINKNLIKILYIAPFKTIIKEKVIYLEESFSFLNLKIMELTGDSTVIGKDFETSNIIIGTPEKIDLFTREKINNCFFSQIKLLIIDEIHLLNDERGPILEQTILRFLLNFLSKIKDCRIVSLSATFPNYRDLGNFINANPLKNIFYFGEIYREIPINYNLISVKTNKGIVKKSDNLNQILWHKILNIVKNSLFYRLIIFVHSRKDTLKTGLFILKNLKKYSIKLMINNKLKKNNTCNFIFELNEKKSKLLYKEGIAIHHAGLSSKDKMIAENLFSLGITPIIVSTSTLSWGVNLPATHVIIKGTKIYSPKKSLWIQLSNLNIIQMLGRVARIENKSNNQGILLTSYRYFFYYKKLFEQKKAIESKLIYILPNSFNIECSRSTIKNFLTAKIWISNSFFWIRLNRKLIENKNKKYSIFVKNLNFYLNNLLVSQTINQLTSAGMINYNKKKRTIQNTYLGSMASNYGIDYQTIVIIIDKLLPYLNQSELIRIFTFSSEFSNLCIRIEEKEELKKLASICIFSIKETSDNILFKINVLIQSYIFNFRLKNMSLSADLIYVGKFGGRYFRFLFEISLNKRWANLSFNTLEIYHLIKNRFMFSQKNSICILKNLLIQNNFNFINKKKIKFNSNEFFLKNKVIDSTKNVFNSDNININENFFFLDLILNLQPITRNTIKFSLLVKTKVLFKQEYTNEGIGIWFFIEDQLTDLIVTYQYLWVPINTKVENLITTFIPIFDNPFSPYFCLKLITDNIKGFTYYLPINFTKINFPINYPILTEFLSLKNNFNFRIFNGFRGGNTINEYFLSNFKKLPFSINQNINYVIKNTNNKAFFLPVNTSKEFYSELSTLPFIFSKKSYNLFFILIGNESIALKLGKLRKNSFGMLGISVEIIKIEFPGIFQNISNNKSIFISSLTEVVHSNHIFKKNNSHFPVVYIFEFFHLIGDINFSNQIEFFFCSIKYYLKISLESRFISISFFLLNSFNVISWCIIKFFTFASLSKKKNFFKKIHFKKMQNFEIENFMKLFLIDNQNFYKKNYINNHNLILIANNSEKIKNNIINLFDCIIQYPISKKIFKLKIISKIIKKKKVNKIFLCFNFAIINEADKFNERRIVEEFFCGNYLTLVFMTFGTFSITSSQKLNSYFGLILTYNLRIQEINFFNAHFNHFFNRFNFFFLVFNQKNFVGYFYYFRGLVSESKLNLSLCENLLSFIVHKGHLKFFLLNKFLTSTFFFLRINNNPNYYGFKYKNIIIKIFKKIINPLLAKLWFYKYIAICKYNSIQTLKKGLAIVYYFFKQKEYKKILSKKKKLNLFCIFKILTSIEEFTFFANKKLCIKKKKLAGKIFLKYHFCTKWRNLYKATLIKIKKVLNIWFIIFDYKNYLKIFFLVLELFRTTSSYHNKRESDFLNQPEFDKFTVFLLGKIHKIFYRDCLNKFEIKLIDLKRHTFKNFKQLSEKIYSNNTYKYLFLTFFLKKNTKLFKFNLNIQENFTLFLFSKYFFKNIIRTFPKKTFFYIVIGDMYINRLIFWKKFYFTQKKFVHFFVDIKNQFKKFKIFVLNHFFCYLDREFYLSDTEL
jgi:replicative superfamily II helicase